MVKFFWFVGKYIYIIKLILEGMLSSDINSIEVSIY